MVKNTKHKLFAQELAKGSSEAPVCEAAGFAPDISNASKLTENNRAAARIAEIRRSHPRRAADLIQRLDGKVSNTSF
jgi:hypothetical protein